MPHRPRDAREPEAHAAHPPDIDEADAIDSGLAGAQAPGATVTLPRLSGPPLRLRAACVACTADGPGPEPHVEIRLWRRAGAGWAVSIAWRGPRGLVRDAWLAPDLETAVETLERRRPERSVAPASDPIRRLAHAIGERRLALAAEEAIGEALFQWRSLPRAEAPGRGQAAHR